MNRIRPPKLCPMYMERSLCCAHGSRVRAPSVPFVVLSSERILANSSRTLPCATFAAMFLRSQKLTFAHGSPTESALPRQPT